MKVYLVLYKNKDGFETLSQEGYDTVEKAKKFIENRFSFPEQVDDWIWQDYEGYKYFIREIDIK